jgi:tetratricopeptide (TPR) repeat protein
MNPTTQNATFFERVESILVYVTTLLVIIGFIPSNIIPFDSAKTVFISIGMILAFIAYMIGVVKTNSISLPKGPLAYTIYLSILSIIISSLTTNNFSKSFFGQGFELYSGALVIVFLLTTLFSSKFFEGKNTRISTIYSVLTISYIVVFIFQAMKIFGGDGFLTLGVFTTTTSSLLGRWVDFSIFSTVILLLSLFLIRFLGSSGVGKFLSILLFTISGIAVIVTNVINSWVIIFLATLLFIISETLFSHKNSETKKTIFERIPKLALILMIASVFAYFGHNKIGEVVYKVFKINSIEIGLPWQFTLDIGTGTIKESPLFGSGPNRFTYEFLKYKPSSINSTPFWGVEFKSGVGTIPTLFINQGLLGTVLWLVFLAYIIMLAVNIIRNDKSEGFKKFIIQSSLYITLSLWFINIIYSPSHAVVFITFLFTGILLSQLPKDNKFYSVSDFKLGSGSLIKKVSALLPFVIILAFVFIGLNYIKKTIAIAYFQRGIAVVTDNQTKDNIDKSEKYFNTALKWDRYDVYYQALTELTNVKISIIIQDLVRKNTTPTKAEIDSLAALITQGIEFSKKAIAIDSTNYYNYTSMARVSESVSSLNVNGAYENARGAYTEAIKYNPYNPFLYLSIARLDALKGNFDVSKQNIQRALILKPDYLDAVYLLSQVQTQNREINNAIQSTKVAIQIDPSNPVMFFQLGLLYYNNKNYINAGEAFAKAVSINGQYANAKYFLGLSYAMTGQRQEAIKEFEDLSITNPDNKEVSFILSNLKSGRSPFTDAKPPVDSKPEKRAKLPITEKSSSKSKSTN